MSFLSAKLTVGTLWCFMLGCGQEGLLSTNGTQAGRVHLAVFPEEWAAREAEPPNYRITGNERYFAVRRAAARVDAAILTMASQHMIGGYAAQIYLLAFGSSLTLKPSSRAEWDNANPLEKTTLSSLDTRRLLGMHLGSSSRVSFAGREYVGRDSAIVEVAVLSPNHRWLAMVSSNVKRKPESRDFFGFIGGGGGIRSGPFFLDIYDTRTGVVTAGGEIRGRFHFSGSSWFGSDLFLLPLDNIGQRCVVVWLGDL